MMVILFNDRYQDSEEYKRGGSSSDGRPYQVTNENELCGYCNNRLNFHLYNSIGFIYFFINCSGQSICFEIKLGLGSCNIPGKIFNLHAAIIEDEIFCLIESEYIHITIRPSLIKILPCSNFPAHVIFYLVLKHILFKNRIYVITNYAGCFE